MVSMSLYIGFGALALVFLLVVLLGLQLQITRVSRKLDEILNKLDQNR
ncbi:MAG: hypothetical protein QME60_06340 [Verrucomicrobiota bacterium]|nr:hypothetical protein [Verrucomicrobiota bacterium]